MSWQADMLKRHKEAKELGLDLNCVDEELIVNYNWLDEDTATTLMDCLIDHIKTNK